MTISPSEPRRAELSSDAISALVCRVTLASPFLFSAATKILDLGAAAEEVRALTGLEPAGVLAVLVVATQLGGGVLLIAGGRWVVAGAALLAAFTVVATLFGHAFWTKDGVAAVRDVTTFLEHLGLVGGLVLAALFEGRREARAP